MWEHVKVKVKSLSRVQLCDPKDCSRSGSSGQGTFQVRELEWIAISFSRGSFRPRNSFQDSSRPRIQESSRPKS